MTTCKKCGREAVIAETIEQTTYPSGVSEDGFVVQTLSPEVSYWKHPDGRFCSQAEQI